MDWVEFSNSGYFYQARNNDWCQNMCSENSSHQKYYSDFIVRKLKQMLFNKPLSILYWLSLVNCWIIILLYYKKANKSNRSNMSSVLIINKVLNVLYVKCVYILLFNKMSNMSSISNMSSLSNMSSMLYNSNMFSMSYMSYCTICQGSILCIVLYTNGP